MCVSTYASSIDPPQSRSATENRQLWRPAAAGRGAQTSGCRGSAKVRWDRGLRPLTLYLLPDSIAPVPILRSVAEKRSTEGPLLIGCLVASKHVVARDSCFAHSCSCAQKKSSGQVHPVCSFPRALQTRYQTKSDPAVLEGTGPVRRVGG